MRPVVLRRVLDKIFVSDLYGQLADSPFGEPVARHDMKYSICDMENQTTSETWASQELWPVCDS